MTVYLVPDTIAPTPEITSLARTVLTTLAELPAAVAEALRERS